MYFEKLPASFHAPRRHAHLIITLSFIRLTLRSILSILRHGCAPQSSILLAVDFLDVRIASLRFSAPLTVVDAAQPRYNYIQEILRYISEHRIFLVVCLNYHSRVASRRRVISNIHSR